MIEDVFLILRVGHKAMNGERQVVVDHVEPAEIRMFFPTNEEEHIGGALVADLHKKLDEAIRRTNLRMRKK